MVRPRGPRSRRSASSPTRRRSGRPVAPRRARSSPATLAIADRRARTPTETADEINDQIGSFLTPALLALAGRGGPGRRLHHLQHLLDHRRPAHARVRDAAGARRHPRPDPRASSAPRRSLIGLVASGLGIALGIGFAKLLNALFDAVGIRHPARRPGARPRGRSRSRSASGSASPWSRRWSRPCARRASRRSRRWPACRRAERAAPAASTAIAAACVLLIGGWA